MTYKERWAYLLKAKGLSMRKFSVLADTHTNQYYYWTKNEKFPDTRISKNIKEAIPELNFNWLFFGEGEPFLNENVLPTPSEDENLSKTLTKPKQENTVEVVKNEVKKSKLEANERRIQNLERRLLKVEKHSPYNLERVS